MAVRVKIVIEFGSKTIETVAIANAGYETDDPEILIPQNLAKYGWKDIMAKAKSFEYKTFMGIVKFKYLGDAKITAKTSDKLSPCVIAKLFTSNFEKEVLMNDKLIGKLGLVLIDSGLGKWKFIDDTPQKERESELPERW